jgi:hypothetical protein
MVVPRYISLVVAQLACLDGMNGILFSPNYYSILLLSAFFVLCEDVFILSLKIVIVRMAILRDKGSQRTTAGRDNYFIY